MGGGLRRSLPQAVVLLTAVAGSRVEAEEAVQEAFVRALGLTTATLSESTPIADAHIDVDTRLALLHALRQLPFAQREALALHYLADLPLVVKGDHHA